MSDSQNPSQCHQSQEFPKAFFPWARGAPHVETPSRVRDITPSPFSMCFSTLSISSPILRSTAAVSHLPHTVNATLTVVGERGWKEKCDDLEGWRRN